MTNERTGLIGIPVGLSYIPAVCPSCDCVFSIPETSWVYLQNGSWACLRCGQICRIHCGHPEWTEDKITLGIDANRFIEQQIYSAQERLDKLLKRHDNIGIQLTCGSLTGLKNDLVIAQVFTTRDCQEGTGVWTGVEDDLETLLIYIGQYIGAIEEAIEEKDSRTDE